MNPYRGLSIMLLTCLIVFATTSAFAAVPLVTSYQGRLLDASDQPLTGSYTMVFHIYDVPVGGVPLWTEDHVGVLATDGLFSVALGATVPLTAELLTGSGGGGGGAGGFRYLQIQVAGQPPISPRTPLSAVPYAVASGSVSGDIQTAPGRVSISNATGTKGLAFTATNDSASITIDEAGTSRVKISGSGGAGGGSGDGGMISITGDPDFDLLRLTSTQDSAKIRISGQSIGDPDFDLLRIVAGKGAGDGGMISITGDPDFDLLRLAATQDSAKIRISGQSIGDPDFDLLRIVGGTGIGTAGASVMITGDPDFDLLRMSADHDSAKIRLGGKISGDPDFDLLRLIGGSGASHLMMQSAPSGADAISQSLEVDCDNTNSRLSIKTKGTSARRDIRHTTSWLVAESSVGADLDGDGVDENDITSTADATGSRMAIKTKGTGAQAGRVVSVTSRTEVDSAFEVCSMDLDGDGAPESIVEHKTKPSSGSSTIKGGMSGSTTATIRQQASPDSATTVLDHDSDGDGVNDNEASMTVTPTTSSVAIKTKGTGADANRVASLSCIGDVDGDGTVDRQVHVTADSTTAGISIDEPGVHIAAEAKKGWDGTIKGRIAIDEGGTSRVLFDSDGDGYFAAKVGIGVDVPTHRIDVAGGAYCDGANWVNFSDVNSKENFQPIEGSELLDQIEQLAITRWNYKGNDQAEHIGPMAQDFKAAFGVGSDGKSISTIDPAGIALAAIKALRIEAKSKTQQIDDLQSKVDQLQALVERLLAEKK